jgi:hypothetical protein
MEESASQHWFLRKYEDGSLFGPIAFEQLAEWASTAQIAPHDSISADGQTWMKAPMLPLLRPNDTRRNRGVYSSRRD